MGIGLEMGMNWWEWEEMRILQAIPAHPYCRQSLTICAINYSGRASELGGTVNLVDRRRSSLSRSVHPAFSG